LVVYLNFVIYISVCHSDFVSL